MRSLMHMHNPAGMLPQCGGGGGGGNEQRRQRLRWRQAVAAAVQAAATMFFLVFVATRRATSGSAISTRQAVKLPAEIIHSLFPVVPSLASTV